MSEKRYALKYNYIMENNDGKGYERSQIDEGFGACDAFVCVSIIREGEKAHDGALSVQIFSCDGQNDKKSIPDSELFMVWSMLASELRNNQNVSEWQREIASLSFDAVQKVILAMRDHVEFDEFI